MSSFSWYITPWEWSKDEGFVFKDPTITGLIEKYPVKGVPTVYSDGSTHFITPNSYSASVTRWIPFTVKMYNSRGELDHIYHDTAASYYLTDYNRVETGPEDTVEDAVSRIQDHVTNVSMMTKDLVDAESMSIDYFNCVKRSLPELNKGHFIKAACLFLDVQKLPRLSKSKRRRIRNEAVKATVRYKGIPPTGRTAKQLAGQWLMYQWAVKPSIDAVKAAWARATTDEGKSWRLSVRSAKYREDTDVYIGGYHPDLSLPLGTCIKYTKSTIAFRYGRNTNTLTAVFNNPVVPVWDAIPYSFLIDWFIPVGEYLKQFGYWDQNVVSSGCDSTKACCEYNLTNYTVPICGLESPWVWEYEYEKCKTMSFSRTIDTRLYRAWSFDDVFKQSSVGLSTSRVINAFALLTQRIAH